MFLSRWLSRKRKRLGENATNTGPSVPTHDVLKRHRRTTDKQTTLPRYQDDRHSPLLAPQLTQVHDQDRYPAVIRATSTTASWRHSEQDVINVPLTAASIIAPSDRKSNATLSRSASVSGVRPAGYTDHPFSRGQTSSFQTASQHRVAHSRTTCSEKVMGTVARQKRHQRALSTPCHPVTSVGPSISSTPMMVRTDDESLQERMTWWLAYRTASPKSPHPAPLNPLPVIPLEPSTIYQRRPDRPTPEPPAEVDVPIHKLESLDESPVLPTRRWKPHNI